ncbi:hypothetical protein [Kamptonema formosum]|uniref:hypothetical protein n=1 Tax=Kamptonema formosum TaxID=331992 RepID=UPI0012DCF69E|nr:hypothetical protein [Oscillatoria sp. PCC 10802]
MPVLPGKHRQTVGQASRLPSKDIGCIITYEEMFLMDRRKVLPVLISARHLIFFE